MPADDGTSALPPNFDAAALGAAPAVRPSTLLECSEFFVKYIQAYRKNTDVYAVAPLSFLNYRPLFQDPEDNPVLMTSGHNSGEAGYLVGEDRVPIMESQLGQQHLFLPLRPDVAHVMTQTKGFSFCDEDFYDGRSLKINGSRPASGMVNNWSKDWKNFNLQSQRVGRILELGEKIRRSTPPCENSSHRYDAFVATARENAVSKSGLSKLFGSNRDSNIVRECEGLNTEDWGLLRMVIASKMLDPQAAPAQGLSRSFE